MENLLLDVNVILDLCVPRPAHAEVAAAALAHCRMHGGCLWIYAGSVQTLEYVLQKELLRKAASEGQGLTNKQAQYLARRLLKSFCADKQWLAALSGEGDVFDEPDPEDAQLIGALERFDGRIRLLTRDAQLLERYPEKCLTPEGYLAEGQRPAPIDFIDLKTQQAKLRPQIEQNIHRVLHHGQYIMGPEVQKLETRLAQYVGVKHAISCASGTDALLMALMALGIGPGDEVITVPYTWISTVEVIALLRAKPVFVDIQFDTFNMDPGLLEAAITPCTRAIMPVSLYGQCADMTGINAIAEKYHIPVIEDGAQSFGATHHGRKSCSLSAIGCTSFFPSKPVGCYGDGGAVFTDSDVLADTMRQIRVHGQKVKHQHPVVGINGRLDTLQAAILLEKFAVFPEECALRRQAGQRYDTLLADVFGIRTPVIASGNESVYAQYTILSPDRNSLSQKLKDAGIPSVAYYTAPLHLQGAFAFLHHRQGNFPVAEQVASQCLSLPMSPYVRQADQERVANCLKSLMPDDKKS